MSDELKVLVEQQISYYRQHKAHEMVKSIQFRGFVADDYTTLLAALSKELQKQQ